MDANTGLQAVQGDQPLFGEPTDFGILTIISTLARGLGCFGMPQVLVRFLGIRSAEEVRQSRIIAVVWVVISMVCALCIGLSAAPCCPPISAPMRLLRTSSSSSPMILPAFMCGVVVSGILAASMSSASSYLLITGSSVAENIFRGIIKRNATDRQVMIVSRITLAVVMIIGIVIAPWMRTPSSSRVSLLCLGGPGASFSPLVRQPVLASHEPARRVAGMPAGDQVVVWHAHAARRRVRHLRASAGFHHLALYASSLSLSSRQSPLAGDLRRVRSLHRGAHGRGCESRGCIVECDVYIT